MAILSVINFVEPDLWVRRVCKQLACLTVASTLVLAFTEGAWAESSMKPRVKCIEGTWSGERTVINQFGIQNVWAVLEIGPVEAHMLQGTSSWSLLEGTGGNHEEELVKSDSEEVLGAVDHLGSEFYLVETQESGIYRGHLIGRNKIKLFLIQSGAFPVAGFSVMHREGSPPEGCRMHGRWKLTPKQEHHE